MEIRYEENASDISGQRYNDSLLEATCLSHESIEWPYGILFNRMIRTCRIYIQILNDIFIDIFVQ